LKIKKDIDIYNSLYARLAKIERFEKIRELLKDFECAKKSILEIGAGHGDNIPLFRNCGFSDNSIFVNEMQKDRVSNIRLNYPGIQLFEGNIFELDLHRTFDVVFQSTVFTSILKDNDRQVLASKMWDLLNPGGRILWYDFIYNNPNNPNVKKVSVAETRRLFPEAVSFNVQKVTLAPPIGRRVGKLYNVFNMPVLRSHILALIQKK
jgi:SAM-dependent methyltransferase